MAKAKEIVPEVEDKVMNILSNEPSDPVKLDNYNVYVVFKRPSFKDKYKGRAWGSKKLKEIGYDDATEEDPEIAYFFRMWGSVNTSVKRLLAQDDEGDITLDEQTYSDYPYNAKTDMEYSGPFEKYAIEEIFNHGGQEDMFVAAGIIAYTRWTERFSISGDDIKNS